MHAQFRQLADRMEPEGLVDRVLHLSDSWSCLSKPEIVEVERLACAVMEFQRHRVESLIRSAAERPVLVAHMCDGWAGKIKESHVARSGDVKVHGVTTQKQEFLLQRCVYRSRRASCDRMEMLLVPPKPLTAGKGSWNVWTAAQQTVVHPRDVGHDGIAIMLWLQDGALCESTYRKLRASSEMRYKAEDTDDDDIRARKLLQLNQEWIIPMACKAHVCSNALKWGIQSQVGSSLVEDAHVCIASLINSSTPLVSSIVTFVQQYMAFVESEVPDSLWQDWFEFLRVPEDKIAMFVEVKPMWDGHKLTASAHLQHQADMFQKVATVLHYSWRWTNWSDTRWVKAGRCARRFLLSLSCGIDGANACSLPRP